MAEATKAATATRDSARQSLADYATVVATLSDRGLHSAHAKGSICVPAAVLASRDTQITASCALFCADEAAALLAGTGTGRPIRAA
jgi:hypothetical protein